MDIQRIEDRCNNCLLCVRDCVAGVWQEVDGEARPVAPELCNGCSHCLAVCPRQAIIHSLLDPEQLEPVTRKRSGEETDGRVYEMIVKSRRSVRRYKEAAVPPAVIQQLIDLARYSPTSSNSQNVAYIIVTDRAVLRKVSAHVFNWGVQLYRWSRTAFGRSLRKILSRSNAVQTLDRYLGAMEYYMAESAAGRDFILHNAPVLILLTAPKRASFKDDNCNIAATNITNYAHALGLGTCYIGFLKLALGRSRKLRRWLGIPANRRVQACLVLGYPAYNYSFTVSRKNPEITWL
ncbi:MAG: nitroreductase family protein [Desulfosudaceae bacterium]